MIRKSGAWYTYGSDQLGQGKENARTFLKDNPELAEEIKNKILAALGVGEPGRKAKEEAAAAAAQAQAATQADADSGAKDGSAKDAAAKGAVKTAKRRTKKNAAELDIDSAFGEDSGGF